MIAVQTEGQLLHQFSPHTRLDLDVGGGGLGVHCKPEGSHGVTSVHRLHHIARLVRIAHGPGVVGVLLKEDGGRVGILVGGSPLLWIPGADGVGIFHSFSVGIYCLDSNAVGGLFRIKVVGALGDDHGGGALGIEIAVALVVPVVVEGHRGSGRGIVQSQGDMILRDIACVVLCRHRQGYMVGVVLCSVNDDNLFPAGHQRGRRKVLGMSLSNLVPVLHGVGDLVEAGIGGAFVDLLVHLDDHVHRPVVVAVFVGVGHLQGDHAVRLIVDDAVGAHIGGVARQVGDPGVNDKLLVAVHGNFLIGERTRLILGLQRFLGQHGTGVILIVVHNACHFAGNIRAGGSGRHRVFFEQAESQHLDNLVPNFFIHFDGGIRGLGIYGKGIHAVPGGSGLPGSLSSLVGIAHAPLIIGIGIKGHRSRVGVAGVIPSDHGGLGNGHGLIRGLNVNLILSSRLIKGGGAIDVGDGGSAGGVVVARTGLWVQSPVDGDGDLGRRAVDLVGVALGHQRVPGPVCGLDPHHHMVTVVFGFGNLDGDFLFHQVVDFGGIGVQGARLGLLLRRHILIAHIFLDGVVGDKILHAGNAGIVIGIGDGYRHFETVVIESILVGCVRGEGGLGLLSIHHHRNGSPILHLVPIGVELTLCLVIQLHTRHRGGLTQGHQCVLSITGNHLALVVQQSDAVFVGGKGHSIACFQHIEGAGAVGAQGSRAVHRHVGLVRYGRLLEGHGDGDRPGHFGHGKPNTGVVLGQGGNFGPVDHHRAHGIALVGGQDHIGGAAVLGGADRLHLTVCGLSHRHVIHIGGKGDHHGIVLVGRQLRSIWRTIVSCHILVGCAVNGDPRHTVVGVRGGGDGDGIILLHRHGTSAGLGYHSTRSGVGHGHGVHLDKGDGNHGVCRNVGDASGKPGGVGHGLRHIAKGDALNVVALVGGDPHFHVGIFIHQHRFCIGLCVQRHASGLGHVVCHRHLIPLCDGGGNLLVSVHRHVNGVSLSLFGQSLLRSAANGDLGHISVSPRGDGDSQRGIFLHGVDLIRPWYRGAGVIYHRHSGVVRRHGEAHRIGQQRHHLRACALGNILGGACSCGAVSRIGRLGKYHPR